MSDAIGVIENEIVDASLPTSTFIVFEDQHSPMPRSVTQCLTQVAGAVCLPKALPTLFPLISVSTLWQSLFMMRFKLCRFN